MSFSLTAQHKSRTLARVRAAAQDQAEGLLEPLILKKLYKATPYEQEDGSTKWKRVIQPHQQKIHDGVSMSLQPCKYSLLTGGVGSGKSLCLCVEMVKLARMYAGIKIVVVTAFDWYFDLFLMPLFWGVFPEEDNKHKRSYNYKSRLLKFTNGSQIQFRAFDEANKIKGWEAHIIWIEEASELGDGNNEKATDIFMALNMRLRASTPAYPLRMYLTQNPKGHNWVWKYFIKTEPGKRQPLGDEGRETIFAYTKEGKPRAYYEFEKIDDSNGDIYYTVCTDSFANAFLPLGYIDSMLGSMADSPGTRLRMVGGKFTPINSLVYDWPIYSERTHLIDYHRFLAEWEVPEIPSWWPVIVGIDTGGARSPWAVEFYAQVPDESHWVCYDEIYIVGPEWEAIANMIKAKTKGLENVRHFIDPHSGNATQGPTNTTIKEEFLARGIWCDQPKGYNKRGGSERVRSLLARDTSQQNPYNEDDVPLQNDDGTISYAYGAAKLYYLTNVPGKNKMMNADGKLVNPEGHAAPGNIAEKRVFRRDDSRQRPQAESEGVRSATASEAFIDKDDHAQTAEFFAFLGIRASVGQSSNSEKQPLNREPTILYGENRRKNRNI